MAKMGQIWQKGPKTNKQRKYEEKCIRMLILGKKLTCVKFSGAFDGIIALWEICYRTYFPRLPTGTMVTELPW